MADVKLFEVGGCIRDELLGLPTKDVDFVVEADSFEMMEEHLKSMGLNVFLSKPMTCRAVARYPVNFPPKTDTTLGLVSLSTGR